MTRAAMARKWARLRQSQVLVVHERFRLQVELAALAGEVHGRDAQQLIVDVTDERLTGLLVATVPAQQQCGDVTSFLHSPIR